MLTNIDPTGIAYAEADSTTDCMGEVRSLILHMGSSMHLLPSIHL